MKGTGEGNTLVADGRSPHCNPPALYTRLCVDWVGTLVERPWEGGDSER